MAGQPLFETQRSRLLKKYGIAEGDFIARTKPYRSTAQLLFEVQNPLPASSPTMAFAIARGGQTLTWFNYGIGEQIPYGFQETRSANQSDTNLSKGGRTNGTDDFVMEGLSCTNKGKRVQYAANTTPAETPSDSDASQAYVGKRPIYDPGSLVCPPQMFSPFNGENAMFQAVLPFITLDFVFDRGRMETIGSLDEIGEGGPKSLLNSNGEPNPQNRYKVPEGFLWRRSGEPDSEFIARGTLVESVVIPISLVGLGGQTSALTVPRYIMLDIGLRLHGLSISLPSKN